MHLLMLQYMRHPIMKVLNTDKGQMISKCLFGVFNFYQKTNENKKNSWLDNLLSKLTDL